MSVLMHQCTANSGHGKSRSEPIACIRPGLGGQSPRSRFSGPCTMYRGNVKCTHLARSLCWYPWRHNAWATGANQPLQFDPSGLSNTMCVWCSSPKNPAAPEQTEQIYPKPTPSHSTDRGLPPPISLLFSLEGGLPSQLLPGQALPAGHVQPISPENLAQKQH